MPIEFHYDSDELIRAVQMKHNTPGKAIAYEIRDHGEYFIIKAIVELEEKRLIKQTCYGTIGIDLNIDHMAVCETDDKGNIVNTKLYRYNLKSKTSNQRKTILQQCIKQFFDDFKERRKPIIIEELDFEKKKMEQLYKKKKYNAMLSSFAYAQFKEYIVRRFYRGGIDVNCIDPSNTSKIGKEKYMKAKGMSIHMSASYVIARRGMGYKDTLK